MRDHEPARNLAIPDESTGCRPAHGGAFRGDAEAVARASHPAQSAAKLRQAPIYLHVGAEVARGGKRACRLILKSSTPQRWPTIAFRGRENWKSRPPSRSPTSATWRWPI